MNDSNPTMCSGLVEYIPKTHYQKLYDYGFRVNGEEEEEEEMVEVEEEVEEDAARKRVG